MRCDSSAELLTRGAAWGYLWRDKARGHQAGGWPEMSAANSGSSLGFLGWKMFGEGQRKTPMEVLFYMRAAPRPGALILFAGASWVRWQASAWRTVGHLLILTCVSSGLTA